MKTDDLVSIPDLVPELETYLYVHRCWQDHDLAKSEKMSVERAIKLLRECAMEATKKRTGTRLATRCYKLLDAIVCTNVSPVDNVVELPRRG